MTQVSCAEAGANSPRGSKPKPRAATTMPTIMLRRAPQRLANRARGHTQEGKRQRANGIDLADQLGAVAEAQEIEIEQDGIDAAENRKADQGLAEKH